MSSALPIFASARKALENVLGFFICVQMIGMAGVVIIAVVARTFGEPFSWYDEVASIQLAWLTYYGAAYAALRRGHIGFPGLVEAMPEKARIAAILFGEVVVVGFFVLLAWVGYEVLVILEGDNLVSLSSVPTQFTQSVIPIGAALFVVCELLSLPEALRGELGASH